MSILESMNAMKLQARKDRIQPLVDVLSFLVSECTRNDKTPPDSNIIATLKKFVNSSKDLPQNDQVLFEIEVAEKFIPAQLSDNEITIIMSSLSDETRKDFKSVMQYFDANHNGCFNKGSLRAIWLQLQ